MRLIVSTEHRFLRTATGVWSETGAGYPFWTRYLEVFDEVRVLGRVRRGDDAPGGLPRADGPGVSFAEVPYYLGPKEFARQLRGVGRAVREAVASHHDAVVMRVGSTLAMTLWPELMRDRRPYGLEVVGDPHDVYGPHAVRHPLRRLLRWWFTRDLRRQCADAAAVGYVTAGALQERYPPSPSAFVTHYSSIELPAAALAPSPRRHASAAVPARLVSVGSLAQLYKGPHVLLDAMARCVADGLDVHLTWVGDGKHRPALELQARHHQLADRVSFVGQVPPGDAVTRRLDEADLFVLPSLTEGLPRAMIEAMSRGLPCIGSNVGGIPELLPGDDLVVPGDASQLARKISEVVTDRHRMDAMSVRSLITASGYTEEHLRERRNALYRHLRGVTQRWVAERGG